MRIGLFGYNTAQGLGYLNRDIANCLGIDRWIVSRHSKFPMLPLPDGVDCRVISKRTISVATARQWLKGLDVLLFAETVRYVEHLPQVARSMGIKVVCVPMVENLNLQAPWIKHVHTWLAPTAFAFNQLLTMRLPGRVEYCPWLIDTRRIKFRQRTTCERFVYAQGNGGRNDRKGGMIVAEAARIASDMPLIVYSQVQDGYTSGANHVPVSWPSTVDFRGSVKDPSEIYQEGDVFIAPSRFEGLGLPLIECQAAGMPLITTDAAPMNEMNPWVRLQCMPKRVQLANYPYVSWDVRAETLVRTMRETIGADITQASTNARNWVTDNRDWTVAADKIRSMLAR